MTKKLQTIDLALKLNIQHFAEKNLIKTPDLGTPVTPRTVAFVEQFANNFNNLAKNLNVFNVIKAKNGIVIPQKFVATLPDGDAARGIVAEGEEIPLTHVKRVDADPIKVALRKHRLAVTVEEVMRVGYNTAVNRTSETVMDKISEDMDGDFYKFFDSDAVDLGAVGTLQEAFGLVWGNVNKAFNTVGKSVIFVNPIDAGKYLGSAAIENGQAVGFGLTLLTNFTNVTVVVRNSVPEGTYYATAEKNINVAVPELDDEVRQLFNDKRVYTDENNLMIAVENSETKNATGETLILSGATFFPEVTNGVFKGTFSAPVESPTV